jgi:hypothetical protein
MKERICRYGDEKTYQLKILMDRIKALYVIGVETGLPMTVLVDYAIRGYVKAYNEEKEKEEEAKKECKFRMEMRPRNSNIGSRKMLSISTMEPCTVFKP